MGNKYFSGKVENKQVKGDMDDSFIQEIDALEEKIVDKMNHLQVSDAISEIFQVLRSSNKYIDDTTPWILAKDETKKDRLETVIYHLLESIRVCSVFLEPFLPDTSEKIRNQINQDSREFQFVQDLSYQLNSPEPLFMRIDTKK